MIQFLFLLLVFAHPTWASLHTPLISVSIDSDSPLDIFKLSFEENSVGDLPKKVFKKISTIRSDSVQIHSFVIAQNLLAIFAGLTRGTDALQVGEIESRIDTSDQKDFINLMIQMANERRHVEDPSEWNEIALRFRGALCRARFNAYLFSTGYIEVTSDKTHGYVRVDQLLTAIDKKSKIVACTARLKILQSLVSLMLDEFNQLEEIAKMGSDENSKENFKQQTQDCPKEQSATFPSNQSLSYIKDLPLLDDSFQDDLLSSVIVSFFAAETLQDRQLLPEGSSEKSFEQALNGTAYPSLDDFRKRSMGILLADLHKIYRTGTLDGITEISSLVTLHSKKRLCLFKLIYETYPELPGKADFDSLLPKNLNCRDLTYSEYNPA